MPPASLFSVWLSEAQELHEFAPERQQTEFEHDPAAVAAEKPGVRRRKNTCWNTNSTPNC